MEKERNILKRAGKWFDNKKIAVGMAVIFAATLLPMLMVAQYSHASADDFGWNAGMRREVWNTTHSLWQLFKVAVQNTAGMYSGWQGTFTTTFIQAFQPEIFNVKAYFIVPYLIMPFFFGGSALLLYYILVKLLKISKPIYAIVTFLYLLITVQYIPSTGEAFYWFNGAVAYTLAYAAAIFCIYFSLRYILEKKKRHLALAVFTAFFVGGGNYLSLVLLPLLLILLLFLFSGKIRHTWHLLLPLAVFGVTAIVNMKAPGTTVRGGAGFGFDMGRAVTTIGRAVYNGTKSVLNDYLRNPVIVLCVVFMLIFLVAGMVKNRYDFPFKYPVLFVGMTLGSYFAMYAPTYYAGVGAPFGRMCNLISFWFELGLILDIVYVTGFFLRVIRKRAEKTSAGKGKWDHLCDKCLTLWDTYKIYILAVTVLFIAVHPDWYEMSATKRTTDYLVSGEAAQFGKEMDARYELYLNDEIKDVVVEPLSVSAGTLFSYDVVEDPAEWPNTAVAEFFHKDSVRLGTGEEAP